MLVSIGSSNPGDRNNSLITLLEGYIQSTIGKGERCSSAIGYLEPALRRRNLDVLIHNTVTRLVPSIPTHGRPTFKTVEFASGPTGKETHRNFVLFLGN